MFGISTQCRFGGKHPQRSVVTSRAPILKAGERRPSHFQRLNSKEMEEFQRREVAAREIIRDLKRSTERLEAEFIGFPSLRESEDLKSALEKVTVLLQNIWGATQVTKVHSTTAMRDTARPPLMNSLKNVSGKVSPRIQHTTEHTVSGRVSPRIQHTTEKNVATRVFQPVERALYQYGPIAPTVPLGLHHVHVPLGSGFMEPTSSHESARMQMTPRSPVIVKAMPSSNSSLITPRGFGPSSSPSISTPQSNMLFAHTDGRRNLQDALAQGKLNKSTVNISRSMSPVPRSISPAHAFQISSPISSARMDDAAYESYLDNLREMLDFTHQEIDMERKRQEELQHAYEVRAKQLANEIVARN